MGCTHVPDCPLFPKLNASLRGWRDAYCDSDSAWRDCARYQQSNSGKAVPLALLPNGRLAQTITRSRAWRLPVAVRDSPGAAARPGFRGTPFEREPIEPERGPEPAEPEAPQAGGTRVAARWAPSGEGDASGPLGSALSSPGCGVRCERLLAVGGRVRSPWHW